jgi:hypothetical protein
MRGVEPVGMPRDWMPAVSFDASSRIGSIMGYTGQGVSTSNLCRTIARRFDRSSSYRSREATAMAQRRSPNWEMEPLRWLVVRYMQGAFLRIDEGSRGRPATPCRCPAGRISGQALTGK